MTDIKRTRKASPLLAALLDKADGSYERTRNRMLIAAKIGRALRERGITQKQFAQMTGRTESEISDWLSGDRNFTIDTLTDISVKLGIQLLDTRKRCMAAY